MQIFITGDANLMAFIRDANGHPAAFLPLAKPNLHGQAISTDH